MFRVSFLPLFWFLERSNYKVIGDYCLCVYSCAWWVCKQWGGGDQPPISDRRWTVKAWLLLLVGSNPRWHRRSRHVRPWAGNYSSSNGEMKTQLSVKRLLRDTLASKSLVTLKFYPQVSTKHPQDRCLMEMMWKREKQKQKQDCSLICHPTPRRPEDLPRLLFMGSFQLRQVSD